MPARQRHFVLLFCLLFGAATDAAAEPVPRAAPSAGAVIATKLGEEIEFVEAPSWRGVEVLQNVKAGDVLRTNAFGQIAILFSDHTQVRIGRNSTLLVKERVEGGDTRLQLTEGSLFARAARGGGSVSVETPAATAAIRGTDWSMQVDGDRTSLSVLEGRVEFFNPQGAVTVEQGEAAAATLGSAPTKVVIVATDTREQMLISLSLRSVLEAFPVTDPGQGGVTAAQARLAAIPPARRGAEDRVLAAEIAADRLSRPETAAAVAAARALPLTAEQDARLMLVEAGLAGSAKRYGEAARLYDRALPHLRGERRSAAIYQSYFARSLAEPSKALAQPAPTADDRIAVAGRAIIAAFLETPKAALAILLQSEPRFRRDAEYQAAVAQIAILAGDFDTAKQAVERAVAIEPGSPDVLAARAAYRTAALWDLKGARADIEAAIVVAPGNSGLYNDLGLIEGDRGASREAERALRQAVALDPEDPVSLSNLAVQLLDENRIEEAAALIDRALAADPSFDLGYLARGRQQLQQGDTDAAIESLLKATTANPAYSNGLVMLGAAYANRGEVELAAQAFENADRLDPRDPFTAQARAALAIDQYQADEAITFAQESVARTRARGGDYAPLAATREGGSTLGSAYRLLSLDAWGRYWGDVVFDPFSASAYFDQSLVGAVSPIVADRGREGSGPDPLADYRSFSSLAQGLLLDPLALVGSNLHLSFLRTPFVETEVGAGASVVGNEWGPNATATLQTLGYAPMPYSLLASVTGDAADPDFADQDEENITGLLGFGLQPSPDDRVVGFLSAVRQRGGIALERVPTTAPDRTDTDALNAFLGWSHSFGYRNVLNAAVFATHAEQSVDLNRADPVLGLFPSLYETDAEQESWKVGLSHAIGSDLVTLRYGGEAGRTRQTVGSRITTDFFGTPVLNLDTEDDDDAATGRVWIDAFARPVDGLTLEAALFADTSGRDDEGSDLAPRVGLAVMPVDGQWLRAGFLRERPVDDVNTLAPTGVVGLNSDTLPIGTDEVDTTILRWDSEWSPHFFTTAEYQHQEIDGLTLATSGYVQSVAIPNAEIDRLSFTANLWLGHGLGAFGTVSRLWSEGDARGTEDGLPFVPENLARVGLTFVSPSRLKITATETYLGDRASNVAGIRLDESFVTDVYGSWETPDRHLAVEFGAYNLFDEELEVAPLVDGATRTISATVKARF